MAGGAGDWGNRLRMSKEYSLGEPLGKSYHVMMTAAHGGFDSHSVPLGGGAAVCERLCKEWSGRDGVKLTLVGSGPQGPEGISYYQEAVGIGVPSDLDELAYARFCRLFQAGVTSRILQLRPSVVLSHDISEGPDFERLHEAGIPVVSIFHVDVADFFNRMYLRNWLPLKWVIRIFHWLSRWWLPDILRLVFEKQEDAIRYSNLLVVPSKAMADIMYSCYVDVMGREIARKLIVIPWGAPEPQYNLEKIKQRGRQWRNRLGLTEGPVLLMVARISPEKGQDRLLEALMVGEKKGEVLDGLTLIIAGEAAYMQGRRFQIRLRNLSRRLRKTRVCFVGHVGALDKAALYEMADLFVSAARHESYGLTIMEAMSYGTPVVALDTYGARETVTSNWGELVAQGKNLPERLWAVIRNLLNDRPRLRQLGEAAAQQAQTLPFRRASDTLLEAALKIAKY